MLHTADADATSRQRCVGNSQLGDSLDESEQICQRRSRVASCRQSSRILSVRTYSIFLRYVTFVLRTLTYSILTYLNKNRIRKQTMTIETANCSSQLLKSVLTV